MLFRSLESLRRRKVFELVDPPKGCKVIKNQWVFDLKSDGQKKARLVAKGFSQVEGIDYDEIFSLVVWFVLRFASFLTFLPADHDMLDDYGTALTHGTLPGIPF